MEVNLEASERLIDQPPGYEYAGAGVPQHQFEFEEDGEENNHWSHSGEGGQRLGWLHSMKEFGKNRITVPVRYLIDPITNFWNGFNMWIDGKLNRVVNPLLARRFFVISVVCLVLVVVRLQFSSNFASASSLRDHSILRDFLRSKISIVNLKKTTEYFGEMPHYAGSMADDSTSNYVHDYFESLGLLSSYDRHMVFLSHGNETYCELKRNGVVAWSSNLQEGPALDNPTASQKQPFTQMALVLPGDAEGQLIYANFGSERDFEKVDAVGKIVLVKYSSEPAGEIALRAEKYGAVGILFMSHKHPTEPIWPEGSDYAYDAVQQGSLGSASLYPGDILSPGWSSSLQMVVPVNNAYITHIPAAAISWKDAETLLTSLKGKGLRMDETNIEWTNNGMPRGIDEWWTGPNPDFTLRLRTNPSVESRHEIRNVFGHMEGREMSDRAIIIGTRLDAMCYGSTQLSGLNVMLEVARILADLKYNEQWEPLRSIYFTAWDATSFNYAGVTEWVESVADNLSKEGVVYIDLDLGVSGPDFVVQGNPIIQVKEILKAVALQDHTLLEAVDEAQSFKPIPGYGNHIAFEAHTGVPTIKVGFHNKRKPIPIDSCYDNSNWMSLYGDPEHERHAALVEFISFLALELGDAPLMPFDFAELGTEIHRYIDAIQSTAQKLFNIPDGSTDSPMLDAINLARDSANDVIDAGKLFAKIYDQWDEFSRDNRDPTTGDLPESHPISRIRIYWNEKVAQANKANLDRNGIAHRNWYKNHLFGPEADQNESNNLSGTFPAVYDALAIQSQEAFIETLTDAAVHIHQLAEFLLDTVF